MHDVPAGLLYAFSVPGRLLWPSTFGVPASLLVRAMPAVMVWGAGVLAILLVLALLYWPPARRNRHLVLLGGAFIYLNYILIYCSRAGLVNRGIWTEPQLLYELGGRYHILPLLGLATIVAAALACLPAIRRCDARRGLPALVAAALGLVMLVAQHREARYWDWMLFQPDQHRTLGAVHSLGEVARAEHIRARSF